MRYDEIMNAGLQTLKDADIDEGWLNLGAETQSQNRLNREYMESITFETCIIGSEIADTSSTLFGVKLPAPINIAPIIHGRVLNKLATSGLWKERTSFSFKYDYLEEISSGVNDANSVMWLGAGRGGEIELLPRIIKKGVKVVLIVKPLTDKDKIIKYLKVAEELGCVAVGMDTDAMFGEKAFDELVGPPDYGPQSIEDLKRYKAVTDLPFIIKGVLSVKEAKIVKDEIGADALVVSNHGGEALDYSVPILKVLPKIRKAVGEDMSIFVDSGFRRGTDALKALALGADCVCFATLLMLAFVAYGRNGVANMLRVLYEELQRAMTLTGCKNVAEINPSILVFPD